MCTFQELLEELNADPMIEIVAIDMEAEEVEIIHWDENGNSTVEVLGTASGPC